MVKSRKPKKSGARLPDAKSQSKPPATIKGAVASLLERLLGPAADEGGKLFRAEVSAFRKARYIKLSARYEQHFKARKINPKNARSLPVGVGIKLITSALQEDDDEVLEYWAALAASAADPSGGTVNKIFLAILSDISAIETYVLRFLWYSSRLRETKHSAREAEAAVENARKALERYPPEERVVAIENLIRLGCIHRNINWYALDELKAPLSSFTIGGDDDSLRQIDEYLRALRHALGDLAGRNNGKFVGLSRARRTPDFLPEANHELTNMGIQLMLRCEAKAQKNN